MKRFERQKHPLLSFFFTIIHYTQFLGYGGSSVEFSGDIDDMEDIH